MAATGQERKRAMWRMGAREERLAWAMLIPTMLVVILVAFYPLFQTFANSFTDARMGSARAPNGVGLANYARLLTDQNFWAAVRNTLYFTVVSVLLELILGLVIALVINSRFKGRGLMRAAILIPWAIPTVVSARMWTWMYNDVFGVINDLFMKLGLLDKPVAWLASRTLAMPSIIAVDVWKTTPFMALLLLAGLQMIAVELYEAARVDGANLWQQFWRITLPLLRPTIVVALIFRTLDALRVFDVIWVMTGGASGTESMGTLNRRVLVDFQQLGYGSAISVIIFLIILAFTALYMVTLQPEVE